MSRISTLLSSQPLIEPRAGVKSKYNTKDVKGDIEFINVEFTFPSEPNKQVLKKLSFLALAGQKVALVGTTGCGKSTAIQLIESFYRATKGQILLDGNPIEEYNVHDVRGMMSIVAQNNILFSTTIRENILYGIHLDKRKGITNEMIIDTCKKANAWEFIQEFPRKLETFVGERGQKLSGGQKQRLAIARAIIRNPKILLLDEATSALDVKSEAVVQKALDKMIEENNAGCTIIIAHRLSTIQTCDKIVVLDKGRKVEEGSHAQLLEIPIVQTENKKMISGYYHDLWSTQMREDKSRTKELKSQIIFFQERCARLEGDMINIHTHMKESFNSSRFKFNANEMADVPMILKRTRSQGSYSKCDQYGDVDSLLPVQVPCMQRSVTEPIHSAA
jgi:ABC-type multidrug transport system fused ATPase/permease subunit